MPPLLFLKLLTAALLAYFAGLASIDALWPFGEVTVHAQAEAGWPDRAAWFRARDGGPASAWSTPL